MSESGEPRQQPTIEDVLAFVAREIGSRERLLKAGAPRNLDRERRDLACLKLIAIELHAATRESQELAAILVAQVRQQQKGPSGKLWFSLAPDEAKALVVRALEGHALRAAAAGKRYARDGTPSVGT